MIIAYLNYLRSKIRILFLFTIIFSCKIFCQSKEDLTWILGSDLRLQDYNVIQIKFSKDTIVHIGNYKSQATIYTDVGAICDEDGNIKAIATNCNVMNSYLDTIINSNLLHNRKLDYCKINGDWRFSQSSIILPFQSKKFWLIYMDAEIIDFTLDSLKAPLIGSLNHAIIDFSSDPKGILTNIGIKLTNDTVTSSGLTACKMIDNDGWWLIVPIDGKPCYNIFSCTKDGIEMINSQCIGNSFFNEFDFFGQTSFSPDKNYYARFNLRNGLHLFGFDAKKGKLNDPVYIHPPTTEDNYYGGLCFSPNSQFLYLFCDKSIFQYDLKSQDINNSAILIDTLNLPMGKEYTSNFNHGHIAPDGRIYISGTGNHKYLHVINNPNCKGKECNLIQQAIKLPSINSWGIPNYPYFNDWDTSADCQPNSTDKTEGNENITLKFINGGIIYQKNHGGSSRLTIFDMGGRPVLNNLLNKITDKIETNELPAGSYILTLIGKNSHTVIKYLKI